MGGATVTVHIVVIMDMAPCSRVQIYSKGGGRG